MCGSIPSLREDCEPDRIGMSDLLELDESTVNFKKGFILLHRKKTSKEQVTRCWREVETLKRRVFIQPDGRPKTGTRPAERGGNHRFSIIMIIAITG